jgi:hypothetical protein
MTSLHDVNWREYFPRGVQDPNGPDGEPLTTPTDRRLLWHIEGALAVLATTDYQRELHLALYRYLCETCEHHYRASPADEDFGAMAHCLWCNDVQVLSDPETPA